MPNSASPTTSSHPAEGDMLLQLLKASAQQRDSIPTADMVEDAHLHDPAVAALGPCHTISQYSSHFWPFHASHQSHFQGGLPFPTYAFRPFDSPWSDSLGAWPHASAQRREGLEQINIEGEPVHSSTLQGMKEPSLGASSITQHLNHVARPAVLSKEMCYSQHTHNDGWHPIETHGRIMNVQGVHDAQQDEYKTMAVLRKNKVAEEGDHLNNNSEGLATHSAQATVQADTGWQIAPSSEELEHQDMRDLGSGGTRNERRGRHVRAEYKKKGGNKPSELQEFAMNRVKEARRALDEVGERVRKVEPQTILHPEVTLQGRTKESYFSKPTDDLKKRRGHMQEWRMKQSQFLGQGRDHSSSVVEQLDHPGLPSNCHVISAPGLALEQFKQSLHDMTSVEQRTAPRKEPWCNYNLDEARGSNQGIREEDEEELLKGIVRILDIDDENVAEESNKDKHTPSTLQIQKAKSDELNQRTIQNNQFNCFGTTPAQTMSRFHRKEVTHRSDIGKLSNELLHLFKSLIAQEEEEIRRNLLLSNLEKIILQSWPQAQLFLFGSCANAFGVCNSDIDVCLSVPDEKSTKPELVMKLADVLRTNEMQHVQALTHARVPIVKFTHPETGLSCDICVNNMLAVVNTKLLHDYAQIDHRLRQLAFIVKHWAKQRQVNETYRGTLSSYAYVLMCIYFLQLRRPAILPCLQEMEPTYDVTVSDVHCAYYDQVEKLLNFGKKNKETLGELVISFFDYWAFRHDYRHSVISVRTGSVLSKIEKDWTRRIGNERHLICIEDPFEISHDLGRVVDKHSIRILREEFQRAARILHHDSNPCVTLFEP